LLGLEVKHLRAYNSLNLNGKWLKSSQFEGALKRALVSFPRFRIKNLIFWPTAKFSSAANFHYQEILD